MINILWILVVAASVISQWYIIEEKHKYPKKKIWFFARVGIASIFMYFYLNNGYVWYWSLSYMVFTFWFPFNISLNILRGKTPFYLSAKNSDLDGFALTVFKEPFVVYAFSFILMISSIGIMWFYGDMTYSEIVNASW